MAPVFTANWFNFGRNPSAGGASGFSATGGTKDSSTRTGWTLHVFTASGSLVCTGSEQKTYEILAIGGGGGGGTSVEPGSSGGGGGGAGCLKYLQPTVKLTAGSTYPVTVGEGGAGAVPGTSNARGNEGENTVWGHPGDPITAPAGGYGGGSSPNPQPNNAGGAGGSSGGSGNQSGTNYGCFACEGTKNHPGNADAVSPANGWGNDGGGITPPGTGPSYSGAGGGGAVNGGTNGTQESASGVGGSGARFSFLPPTVGAPGPSPTHRYVAGGGGGSSYDNTRHGADGGTGGGGHGGSGGTNDAPFNATAGTGAGGGGSSMGQTAGSGADGLVVIMYPDS